VVMCLGVVWFILDCPTVFGDRLVVVALIVQGIAEIIVRLGVVRLEADGGAVGRDRRAMVALTMKCVTEIKPHSGTVATNGHRDQKAADRFLPLGGSQV